MSNRRANYSFRRQARLVSPLIAVWAIAAVVIAVASLQTSVPRSALFLDQSALSDIPWYSGVFSNVGYVAWTVAAAAALGGGWVAHQTRRPSAGRFLIAGGSVTVLLLLDDMFRLHSGVLSKVVGLPKSLALVVIVAPALLWLVFFAADIIRTRWLVLGLALAALFGSIVVDQLLAKGPTSLLLEDGAKFLGVLGWMLYFVLTTHDIARSTIRDAMRSTASDERVARELVKAGEPSGSA